MHIVGENDIETVEARDVESALRNLVVHGLVRFRGERTDLLPLARGLGRITPHRDSGADGITTIADDGSFARSTGRAGFSRDALLPHTDRSDAAEPPALLLMRCDTTGDVGGGCVLVDGYRVHADLAGSAPGALRALSRPRSVRFGTGPGRPGAVFERRPGGRIRIRLRLDELATFDPDTRAHLPALRAAVERHAVVFALRAGHGYVLDNHRWLHGRRAFDGPRRMHRLHVVPDPRWRIPAGFVADAGWPQPAVSPG